MNDINGSYDNRAIYDLAAVSVAVAGVAATFISADITSIQQLLGSNEVPRSIEARADDFPTSFRQADTSFVGGSGDKDGDGIPDDSDKHVGRSVADVAAEKLGLGRYKQASVGTKNIITDKGIKTTKEAFSILNKIAAQSAASTSTSMAPGKSSVGGVLGDDEGDGMGILKKMDSMDKLS